MLHCSKNCIKTHHVVNTEDGKYPNTYVNLIKINDK